MRESVVFVERPDGIATEASLNPKGRDRIPPARAPLALGRWYLLLLFLFLSGCSAHSPFILKTTTDSTPVQNAYPPSQERVFVTKQSLPTSVAFVRISTIDVGKVWYGSADGALVAMADRARELGANAIIETRTWHQPAGWAWSAPQGSGLAVRVTDIKSLEPLGIKGEWY